MRKVSLATALGVMFATAGRKVKKHTNESRQESKEPKTYFFDNYGKMQEEINEHTIFKCEAENNKKAKLKFKDWKRKNFSK